MGRLCVITMAATGMSLWACGMGCSQPPCPPVSHALADGLCITWAERLIDDSHGGIFVGADGFAMVDLDGDGREDIISVHEDSAYVRLHFADGSTTRYQSVTLASGPDEAGAVEDVAAGDLDRDGFVDLVTANEAGYLMVFRNPGASCRDGSAWFRCQPAASKESGSWIRVKVADVDDDGWPDILAANKGGTDFCWFRSEGDPFIGCRWTKFIIGRTNGEPINIVPHDVDEDGDVDAIVGSRKAENVVKWLENPGPAILRSGQGGPWPEHLVTQHGNGFNVVLRDISGDGRKDLVLAIDESGVGWAEVPDVAQIRHVLEWKTFSIGCVAPDSATGIGVADVNGDGRPDVIVGGYSGGPRHHDPPSIDPNIASLGRMAWFQHPEDPRGRWVRHDISRRIRGMFDHFEARDLNGDGRVDWVYTRGNSGALDGVFWIEQCRRPRPAVAFVPARTSDSLETPIPDCSAP